MPEARRDQTDTVDFQTVPEIAKPGAYAVNTEVAGHRRADSLILNIGKWLHEHQRRVES